MDTLRPLARFAGVRRPPNGFWLVVALVLLASTPTFAGPAASQPHPAARDPLGDLPSYGAMLRRTAYVLFAIIAALLLAAKVLPRWLGKGRMMPRGKLIEVVEFHRLEPRKAIYLIRVAGQYIVVGSTGDRLETLAGGPLNQEKLAAAVAPKSPATPAPASPPATAEKRSFLEVLRGKHEDGGV